MPQFDEQKSLSAQFDSFILWWNYKFPLDLWYRKRFNIAFNSPQHRELSPLDILFEYREQQLIESHSKEYLERHKALARYRNTGEFFDPNFKPTEEEIDRDFEQMSLSDFDDEQPQREEDNV